MKIATWNVNSVRTRLDHVLLWLEKNPVDLLCLQETKVKDDDFPAEAFSAKGLKVSFHGQPAYNGVAMVSPHGVTNVRKGFPTGDLNDQTRVIACELDGIQVVNVYVPQGSDVASPKFAFKREFYRELTAYAESMARDKLLICGDYNIAPEGKDVHDPEKAEGRVMFTEEEHGWYQTLLDVGLHDSLRLKSEEEGLYSWWDYREASFRRNLGWRIDHHLVSGSLKERVKETMFHKEPRGWEKPSDHIPVVVEL